MSGATVFAMGTRKVNKKELSVAPAHNAALEHFAHGHKKSVEIDYCRSTSRGLRITIFPESGNAKPTLYEYNSSTPPTTPQYTTYENVRKHISRCIMRIGDKYELIKTHTTKASIVACSEEKVESCEVSTRQKQRQ